MYETGLCHRPFLWLIIYSITVQALVTDPTPIATCSKLQLAKAAIAKPVSQSLARPPARAARSKSKPKLATGITSNSFQHTNPVASANQDNHVAGSSSVKPSNASFGEQITLVPRKSRHPAKSGKSTARDIGDQYTTILDFASYLQTQSRDTNTKSDKSKQKPIFCDLIIYYAANGPEKRISHSTKRRMEIVRCFCLLGMLTDFSEPSLALPTRSNDSRYF